MYPSNGHSTCICSWRWLIIYALFILVSVIYGEHCVESQNAPQIFNAIHSSMRQWGSSLNHNGMSYFMATVPEGVQLYHGTNRSTPIEGMEWLAFEPEHAMMFAVRVLPPKWNSTISTEGLEEASSSQQALIQQHHDRLALSFPPSPLQKSPLGPRPRIEPGSLHTYITKKNLHLLYIDGQSAAKTFMGTMDSQDAIILRHIFNDTAPWLDGKRGRHLCDVARDRWHSRIDGFIRMEHGFEIILCDFEAGLKELRVAQVKKGTWWDPEGPLDTIMNLLRAVTSRYDGIGGERVKLNYDHFVSVYSYPDVEVTYDDAGLPRLTDISDDAAARVLAHIDDMVMNTPFPSASPTNTTTTPITTTHDSINWQSTTDMIISRYFPLLTLLTSGTFQSQASLAREISSILSPYIDYSCRNAALEIHRCATSLLPQHLSAKQSHSLANNTTLTITHRICATLHSILPSSSPAPQMIAVSPDLESSLSILASLMTYLSWTSSQKCNPSCDRPDEICFVAIWPWGESEDHWSPRCKNKSGILERATQGGGGYWRRGMGRGPGWREVMEREKAGESKGEVEWGVGSLTRKCQGLAMAMRYYDEVV